LIALERNAPLPLTVTGVTAETVVAAARVAATAKVFMMDDVVCNVEDD
jgi:hypothetical protein